MLARLREREGWPHVDAIAITHFHLDHWGDLVPWVWGSMYRLAGGDRPNARALGARRRARTCLEPFGERFGFPDMFDRVFDRARVRAEEQFEAAGFDVTPLRLPHYTLETYGFRVTADGITLAYSGDSAPSERARRARPRTPTSSSARRRSSAASSTASRAGT